MKPDELYDPSMTRFEWFARRHRRTLLRIRRFVRGPFLALVVVAPLLWFGLFHANTPPVVTVRPPKRSVAKPRLGPSTDVVVRRTTTTPASVTTTTVAALPAGPLLAVSGKPPRTRVYRSRISRRTRNRHG